MAGKAGEDAVESAIDDGSTAEWAVERAEELDLEVHEFLERIMDAYRLAESEGADSAATDESIAELATGIEQLEAEFAEMIEDVRTRVIQVKKESDGKAPADHDHEALEGRLDSVQGELEGVEDRIETVEDRLDGGFENFEEILEYLVDRTETIGSDLETLGTAVMAIQDRVETITAREQARARADRLKTKGAQRGVRTATCEGCGAKVDLAMLSEATCPTCDAVFQDLDPDPGFFGSSTLETGSRPALEAPAEGPEADELETVASGESDQAAEKPAWFTGTGTVSVEPEDVDDDEE